jgi:hypothetical protein
VKLDDVAMNDIPTHVEYEAAISEFDRLWESCAAKQFGEEMTRLLAIIEAYEQQASYSDDISVQRTVDSCDLNRAVLR